MVKYIYKPAEIKIMLCYFRVELLPDNMLFLEKIEKVASQFLEEPSMSDTTLRTSPYQKRVVELSYEERAQLDTIIDLLIPADEDFPPPSSLHLLDDFLLHLLPRIDNSTTRMLNAKRLRSVLRDLNTSAGGRFCSVSVEKQQTLLHHLERREPALFQALWALANHSYYKQLATINKTRLS